MAMIASVLRHASLAAMWLALAVVFLLAVEIGRALGRAALRNHDPAAVLVILIGVAVIAMGFSGYNSGASGSGRRGAFAIMAVTLSLLIVLTIDLDRPERGSIEVSVKPLQDALAQLPAPR